MTCIQNPIVKATTKVPIPTIPPHLQPIVTTITSIIPRQTPIGKPDFLVKATIILSRGPAPNPELI